MLFAGFTQIYTPRDVQVSHLSGCPRTWRPVFGCLSTEISWYEGCWHLPSQRLSNTISDETVALTQALMDKHHKKSESAEKSP